MTGAKHSAYSIKRLADSDKTKHKNNTIKHRETRQQNHYT